MKLLGNFLSPYVRRVAISMQALELPYEIDTFMVFAQPDKIRPHNPVQRIPTLLLDDGRNLIESAAILDYLDHEVGPERALLPLSGRERQDALQIVALAIGAAEKAQTAFYETRFHPPEKVHEPWIQHNDERCRAGLLALDSMIAKVGDGWLDPRGRLGQADISTAVACSFAHKVRPNLEVDAPALAAFTARCEALPAFKVCPQPD